MLSRIAMLGLCLGATASHAVKITYDSPDVTPYCGNKVLALSIQRLFPSAKTATAGSALPLGWSPDTVPRRKSLLWALGKTFEAAQSGKYAWLRLTYGPLVEGSKTNSLVLCVVDTCARLEDGGEMLYVALPQLRVKGPRRIGMSPRVEQRPGEFADRPKPKPAARKKGSEKVPKFRRDEDTSAEPGAPSAIIASTPYNDGFHSIGWVSDYWSQAGRYFVARKTEGFEFDSELAKILDAVAPYAIQAELQLMNFGSEDPDALRDLLVNARRALAANFSGHKRDLKKKLKQYGFTNENLFARALELLG